MRRNGLLAPLTYVHVGQRINLQSISTTSGLHAWRVDSPQEIMQIIQTQEIFQ